MGQLSFIACDTDQNIRNTIGTQTKNENINPDAPVSGKEDENEEQDVFKVLQPIDQQNISQKNIEVIGECNIGQNVYITGPYSEALEVICDKGLFKIETILNLSSDELKYPLKIVSGQKEVNIELNLDLTQHPFEVILPQLNGVFGSETISVQGTCSGLSDITIAGENITQKTLTCENYQFQGEVNIEIMEGIFDYVMIFKDSQMIQEVNLKYFPNMVTPLEIITPKDQEKIADFPVTMMGTCHSNYQDLADRTIEISGEFIQNNTVECVNNTFQVIINASEVKETYIIEAKQRDITKSVTIILEKEEDLLMIDTPINNQMFSQTTIPVTGKCNGNIQIIGDHITNKEVVCGQNNTFSSDIMLSPVSGVSDYQLLFKLNNLQVSRNIKFIPPAMLTIVSPSNGATVSQLPVSIMGACNSNLSNINDRMVTIQGDFIKEKQVECVDSTYNSNIEITSEKSQYNIQVKQLGQTKAITIQYEAPAANELLEVNSPVNNSLVMNNSINIAGICSKNVLISGEGIQNTNVQCNNNSFSQNIPLTPQANKEFYQIQFQVGNIVIQRTVRYLEPNGFQVINPVNNSGVDSSGIVMFQGHCDQGLKIESVDFDTYYLPACNGMQFQQEVKLNIKNDKKVYEVFVNHGLESRKIVLNYQDDFILITPSENEQINSQNFNITGKCKSDISITSSDLQSSPIMASCSNDAFSSLVNLKLTAGKNQYSFQVQHGNDLQITRQIIYIEQNPLVITKPIMAQKFENPNLQITGQCSHDIKVSGDISNSKDIVCNNGQFSDQVMINILANKKTYQINFAHGSELISRVVEYFSDEDFLITSPIHQSDISSMALQTTGTCLKDVKVNSTALNAEVTINCLNGQFNHLLSVDINNKSSIQLNYQHGNANKTVELNVVNDQNLNITSPVQNSNLENDFINAMGSCERNINLSGSSEVPNTTINCNNNIFNQLISLNLKPDSDIITLNFEHGSITKTVYLHYLNDELIEISNPQAGDTLAQPMFMIQGTCRKNVQISGNLKNTALASCQNKSFNAQVELKAINGQEDYELSFKHGEKVITRQVKYFPPSLFDTFLEVYNYNPPGQQSCASCHSNAALANIGFPQFGSTEDEFKNYINTSDNSGPLKGLPMFVGGSVDLSSFVTRLAGSPHQVNGSQTNMPLGASQLVFNPAQMQILTDWIDSLPAIGIGQLAVDNPSNQIISGSVFQLSGTCPSKFPVELTGQDIVNQTFSCSQDGTFQVVVTIQNLTENTKTLTLNQTHKGQSISFDFQYKKDNDTTNNQNFPDEQTQSFDNLAGGYRHATRYSIAQRFIDLFGPEVNPTVNKFIRYNAGAYGSSFDPMAAGENGDQFPEYQIPQGLESQPKQLKIISPSPLQYALIFQACMEIESNYPNQFRNIFNLAQININNPVTSTQIESLLKVFYPWIEQHDPQLLQTLIQLGNTINPSQQAWIRIGLTLCSTGMID